LLCIFVHVGVFYTHLSRSQSVIINSSSLVRCSLSLAGARALQAHEYIPTITAYYRSQVLDQGLQDDQGGATEDVVAFYCFLAGHLADKIRRLNDKTSPLPSSI
ncbi:MAG: hypothetical protein ACK55Z_29780, partial [bacterium]